MSEFVATKVGVFRHWKSNDGLQGFLLLCPECAEWLPVNEEVLAGRAPIDHEFQQRAVFCPFNGLHPELGPTLVSTAQANLLIDGRAWVESEKEAIEQWKDLRELR